MPIADTLVAIINSVECARVSLDYRGEGRGLGVRGHVPSERARRNLVAELGDVAGTDTVVADDLVVVDPAYCDVIDMLENGGLQRVEERGGGATLGDRVQIGETSFREGEAMELAFASPNFAGYLYIDYFRGDGTVIHLQSHGDRAGEPFAPSSRLRIGGPQGASPTIEVAGPLGRHLILVVASSERLYDGNRALIEGADDYLAFFDARLTAADARGARLEYAYQVLNALPADP